MNLIISSPTQATESVVIIKDDSRCKIKESTARVSRSATLDLGAVIDSQGYAVGDRTLEIVASIPEADEDKLWSLYKNNTFLNVSTRDGRFYGAVEKMLLDRGQLEMTFLIKE